MMSPPGESTVNTRRTPYLPSRIITSRNVLPPRSIGINGVKRALPGRKTGDGESQMKKGEGRAFVLCHENGRDEAAMETIKNWQVGRIRLTE